LVDTDGALPAVEVLGGRVPPDVERRANAFAAELLLPRSRAREVSRQHLGRSTTPDARKSQVQRLVDQLADEFDVSHETVAWHVNNSDALSEEDAALLRTYQKSRR
jgi:Zn-dependent peptidase ImmA (M78 family)